MTDSEFFITGNGQKGFLFRPGGGDIHKYKAETLFDQAGRMVFTLSRGLVGVGLPCKANRKELNEGNFYCLDTPDRKEDDVALSREDIQHLQQNT